MSDVAIVPYIETVLREQDAYRAKAPSLLPRAVRSIAGPLDKLTHHLIPAELIEAAIRGADWAASSSIRKSSISHDFSNLEACDAAVSEVRRWTLGYAITGGGAAGAFGVFGLAVDVPATVALALRAAMDEGDWKKIVRLAGQTTGSVAATKRVAATLGINLSTRKMAQIAPVVGAAVGAGVNAAFQNDVTEAARFAYRARWLEVNERIVEGRAG